METPLAEGQRIHYNFVRPHLALGGMTPAQASGLEVKGWKQLIENAQVQKTQAEIEARKEPELIEVSVKGN